MSESIREQVNLRLTETGKTLLYYLSGTHFGISQAAVVELALRELARKQGITNFDALQRPANATVPKRRKRAK